MTNAKVAAVLVALSHATRRIIFERVAAGPVSVGKLAEGLPVSRPAVSQHLRVLKKAGLVLDRAKGTQRIYQIDPCGIGATRDWFNNVLAAAGGGSVTPADLEPEFEKFSLQKRVARDDDGAQENTPLTR